MESAAFGELVQKKRNEKGLTQEDLAGLCHLDTRTIQRVEKGDVQPYFSTMKALSNALEFDFVAAANSRPLKFSSDEIRESRMTFKKPRTIRIALMIAALTVLLGVAASFPTFRIFGLSKLTWAPFLYIFMFGVIISIGLVWRCPACGASLGSPFNTRLCPHCGFKYSAD